MEPKVSLIMGIYNCEHTLPAAIESVLMQSYTNWELVLCDDGSNDNTFKVAKTYKEKYPDKIILLKNPHNMRLAASLNNCLKVATGIYIARMDADDVNLPNRIEVQVSYLKVHPEVDCVGSGMIIFDDTGDHGFRVKPEYPTKDILLKETPFSHPTIMMKKSVFDELGGYTVSKDTQRAEDLDLWIRFMAAGYKGYVIQDALYRYRESLQDYSKRSVKAAWGTTKIYLKGYKVLGFPIYKYIWATKPVVSALLPNLMMQRYHKSKDYIISRK